ncbi:Rhodanese-like domain-containing protein [Clohesyomyces aquaticus]|uniref:Rhodanese-like domain-containing protein n=1 Tax=Clohesyomyces aquaticus TaxID=1231657 RepID=A0A1Y1ZPQ7_9PLEO|nr:Rhodanese-like domain-containing protein [Clohesyomyces aquaticus]
MAAQTQYLIDVRTPAEFSTGYLGNAINIEYQLIHQLPNVVSSVHKNDRITLYCRSGRRSAIAMGVLEKMGYADVRDIGGFEDARRVLESEEGQLDRVPKSDSGEKVTMKDVAQKQARQEALGSLLAGLRSEEKNIVSQTVEVEA